MEMYMAEAKEKKEAVKREEQRVKDSIEKYR